MITMPTLSMRIGSLAACAALLILGGCATPFQAPATSAVKPDQLAGALNRVSWGVNQSTWQQAEKLGYDTWLDRQLHPSPAVLPPAAQAQIDAMTITKKPLRQLIEELDEQRKDIEKITVDDDKKSAQQAYQQELNRVAKEAAARSLLRDLYSPNQLQEQMTWFWMNHFSVHQGKSLSLIHI